MMLNLEKLKGETWSLAEKYYENVTDGYPGLGALKRVF